MQEKKRFKPIARSLLPSLKIGTTLYNKDGNEYCLTKYDTSDFPEGNYQWKIRQKVALFRS